MRVQENIINNGKGPLSPSYLVIHETATPDAPAENFIRSWQRDNTFSVHYVMDWDGVAYHCVPDDRLCWHVGGGNPYTVGIELCHATNRADFDRLWKHAVDFAAWYLKKRSWGINQLMSHDECRVRWGGTDHTDPTGYFEEYGKSWAQFKREVSIALNGSGTWLRGTSKGNTGKWWYRHADGSYTSDGWEKIDGVWYCFDKDGWMRTGWIRWDDEWYYCLDSGKMLASCCREIGGKWYAFAANGAMKTKLVGVDSNGALKL